MSSTKKFDRLKKIRQKISEKSKKEEERVERERIKEEILKDVGGEELKEFEFGKEGPLEEEIDFEEIDKRIEEDEKNIEIEKTVIRRPIQKINVEKTIVFESFDAEKQEAPQEKIPEEPQEVIEEEKVSSGDATQVISQGQIYSYDEKEVESSERILRQEHQKDQKKSKQEKKTEAQEEKKGPKKKMGPIVALAFVALFYVLFDEDGDSQGESPQYLVVKKQSYKKVADEYQSNILYYKAFDKFSEGTYSSKRQAVEILQQSIAFDLENNKAKDLLIYLYAELFENIKDKSSAIEIIYDIISLNRLRMNRSHMLASGTALFLLKTKNVKAAHNVIRNYLKLYDIERKEEKARRKNYLLPNSIYLKSMVANNDLNDAQIKYNQLLKVQKKKITTYSAMIDFLKATGRDEDLFRLITDARKQYPNSVSLLIEYADFLFLHGDFLNKKEGQGKKEFSHYKKVINKVKLLNFEGSPYYYARILEHKGMVLGLLEKHREAIAYIKKSLKILDNPRLRKKLAMFQLMEEDEKGVSKLVNAIINESKSLQAIEESQQFLRKGEYEKAILSALEAKSLLPNFIKAELNFAKVQIARGYFELGLATLEEIIQDNPTSLEINVELVRAYIQAKMVDKARLQVAKILKQQIVQFSSKWQYFSLMGELYRERKNFALAIENFKKSIEINPFNTDDLFSLAKMYLIYRRYNHVKKYLGKALELDPENENFHILYAKVIYEISGADTAVGYLKNRLDRDPENTKFMAAMAQYYYQDGQNKDFQKYKEKIENIPEKDKSIYEFLMEESFKEGKIDDVIKYAKTLLVIDPSDLEKYVYLAEKLYEIRQYNEGLLILKEVKKRLKSYPRIYYLEGKIYVAKRQYKKAIESAEKEIKFHPRSSHGYFIKAEAMRHLGDYAGAIPLLEMAISKNGKDIEALMALGNIRYKQDFFEVARELYVKVQRYETGNSEAYRQLGHIYRKIGQGQLAIENYTNYLNLEPAARDRREIERIIKILK